MTIEERVLKAYELHHQGYNCAQAVMGAYSDVCSTISFEQAMTMSYGLGGGIGAMREVCGCVSGGALVISLLHGKAEADKEHKNYVNGLVSAFGKAFEKENGSLRCGDLLGLWKTNIQIQSCDDYIASAVRLLEAYVS
jgi:C_GCAxxG_C_C family probable redox protein